MAGCGGNGGSASPTETAAIGVGQSRPPATTRTTTIVESASSWEFDGTPGRIIQTPYFRIYTTQLEPMLVDRLPAFLEAALAHYRTAMCASQPDAEPLPRPPLKLDTFVMRSRSQWARLTRQLTGDQAEAFLRIQRGGFAWGGKALLFDIGTYETMSIAAHEGWHQYTQRTFPQQLPVWMEEGIATYMEGHRWDQAGPERPLAPLFLGWANVERFDQLRRGAAENRLLPLASLLDSNPSEMLRASRGESGEDGADELLYYAQVWALTHFLREGEGGRYRAALGALIADAAAGRMEQNVSAVAATRSGGRAPSGLMLRRGPAVFTAYFNENLDEAAAEYSAFLEAVVKPGSRGPIVAGQSPLAR